jgi:hypothetical protein
MGVPECRIGSDETEEKERGYEMRREIERANS